MTILNLILALSVGPLRAQIFDHDVEPAIDAGVVARLIYFAGIPAPEAKLVSSGWLLAVDRLSQALAQSRGVSEVEARRALELVVDPASLVARSLDQTVGGRDIFDEDLRRDIFRRLENLHPGIVLAVAEASRHFDERRETLSRLGLEDWEASEVGLRLGFSQDRWRLPTFKTVAWFERPGEQLRALAVEHLKVLDTLARARATLESLRPSEPRARLLAEFDRIADQLRAQLLDLPRAVDRTIERLEALDRPSRQQQQVDSNRGWHRLGHGLDEISDEAWSFTLAELSRRQAAAEATRVTAPATVCRALLVQ